MVLVVVSEDAKFFYRDKSVFYIYPPIHIHRKLETTTRRSIVTSGYKSQYNVYDKFINALYTPATKKTYQKNISYFLRFTKLASYEDLVNKLTDEEKHEVIADYIAFLKNNRKNAGSTIKIAFAAIKKFYLINRVKLDWDYLSNFKGKSKGKKNDDRLYTLEEINRLLLHSDLRQKVVIHILLSTGMRVGGLADLLIKDMIWLEEYKLYKFKVYAESEDSDDKYTTFCTPECAMIIKKYLEHREMKGDNIKPTSPLIYRKLTRYDSRNKKTVYTDLFDTTMDSGSIQQILTRLQRKSLVTAKEVDDPTNRGRIRKEMMRLVYPLLKILD